MGSHAEHPRFAVDAAAECRVAPIRAPHSAIRMPTGTAATARSVLRFGAWPAACWRRPAL
jgi:hypothetical protein